MYFDFFGFKSSPRIATPARDNPLGIPWSENDPELTQNDLKQS